MPSHGIRGAFDAQQENPRDTMDDSFALSLADWTAFYALAGGAAATLLGLQFVAVSLRLNIFRQRDVADVRDFAAFTVGMFLVAIAIAGLALAPHEEGRVFALALFLVSVLGFLAIIWTARDWVRLNPSPSRNWPGSAAGEWQGLVFLIGMGTPYLGLIIAALLVWRGHSHGLGLLAVVEGWFLVMGTTAAWILLSHAGDSGHDGSGEE